MKEAKMTTFTNTITRKEGITMNGNKKVWFIAGQGELTEGTWHGGRQGNLDGGTWHGGRQGDLDGGTWHGGRQGDIDGGTWHGDKERGVHPPHNLSS